MKKILLILSGTLALLLSCIKEENGVVRTKEKNGFKLSLTILGQDGGVVTKASVPPEPGEETVQSLHLLFFEDQPNGTGMFLNYYQVSGPLSMNTDIAVDFQDGGMGSVGTPLDNNSAYRILAVANLFDNLYFDGTVESWLNSFLGHNEAQVWDAARIKVTGIPGQSDYTHRAILSDEIPMSASFSKGVNQEHVKAELTRVVARFDVINRSREGYDLVSASVWNAFSYTNVWKSGHNDFIEARIKRLFGVTSQMGGIGNDGYPVAMDILGKLYSFENFVSSPEGRDERTTCLIIGVTPRNGDGTTGLVTYHRINVTPADASQYLKRNHVYKVTINNVIGAGAPDEWTAYTQNENMLDYVINSWDLDDNGMVLIDGTNTLVVPVKKVHLKPEGDVREFSIFTMGPGTLTMSRVQLDNGLSAVLVGNRLTISGTPMDHNEDERKGTVVLSLGSLDATIDIIQSKSEDLFLNLNKNKIIEFPAYGAGMFALDGDIIVSASGPWTAKLFNHTSVGSNQGFTFNQQQLISPKTVVTSAEVSDNRIKIYSTGDNPNNESRYAFIIVSLDGHDDINRSLVLSQKPATGIRIIPQEQTQIIFNPLGVVQGNGTFVVEPGTDDGKPSGSQLNQWNVEIVGTGAEHFKIVDVVCNVNETQEQTFTINSLGLNLSGATLAPRVRVFLVGTTPPVETFINIKQDRAEWSIPTSVSPISPSGGNTSEITVDASAGLTYKVKIQSLQPSGIVDHFAYLIDPDDSGNVYSSLKPRSVSKKFAVGFPKLIYPNMDVQVQATIAVSLIETGETKTFVVSQSQVVQYPVNILNVGTSWGQIANSSGAWTSNYNQFYVNYLSSATNFGPSGVVKTNGSLGLSTNNFPASISGSTRYVHYSRPNFETNSTRDQVIYDWIHNNDGIVFISNDENDRGAVGSFGSSRLPGKLGLVGCASDPNGTNRWQINSETAYVSSMFHKYLIQDGPWGNQTTPFSDWTSVRFSASGVTSAVTRTSLLTAMPSAIPILTDNDNSVDQAIILAYDPVKNVVFSGDSEIFQLGTGTNAYNPANSITNTKSRVLANFIAYIVNSAQYGSHFTDYFWNAPRTQLSPPAPQP
ncbi:MAG: hypothetical protein LBC84_09445 [Prevotellaceae bacterium]|jgi:hypothetical protein|nr:hypothetical protein [Prevotellaceae bacterium]